MKQGKGGGLVYLQAFDCHTWCLAGGVEDRKRRADWCCALLDFHPSEWTGPRDTIAVQMGADPEISGGHMPAEGFEDGCPGSWYRCGFVQSLMRYQRPCSNGVFSPNYHLDRCQDPLVHAAVRLWEQNSMRVTSWAHEILSM